MKAKSLEKRSINQTDSASATFNELLGQVLRTVMDSRGIFSGGIAHLRLSISLENGTKIDFEVDGFGSQASPTDAEVHSLVAHDPCHDSEFVEAEEASRDIASLNLGILAEKAANELLSKFPADIKFTSGRRTVAQQASAMAKNVLRNRKFIQQTYKESSQRDALQAWVDKNQALTGVSEVAKGFEDIMNSWNDEQRRGFSRHMTGDAFDVRPVIGSKGTEIKEAIRKLPNIHWVTFNEGGLEIWHAQFTS